MILIGIHSKEFRNTFVIWMTQHLRCLPFHYTKLYYKPIGMCCEKQVEYICRRMRDGRFCLSPVKRLV